MFVKICGITSEADAHAAASAGASAVGFVFARESARRVTPEQAAAIQTKGILRAGVFVDEVPARVLEVARLCRLDIVQLHGAEPADSLPRGVTVWKAFRVANGFLPKMIDGYDVDAVLLDSASPGSGNVFDWSSVAGVEKRIVLAGGLDASNVGEAIRIARPWGVDASTKLESAPGIKDHEKVRRFVAAALGHYS